MYLPGRGFVAAPTSSIVEPQQFVGMRRKSGNSPKITPTQPHNFDQHEERGCLESKIPLISRTSPATDIQTSENAQGVPAPVRTANLYNRRNPERSVLVSPVSKPTDLGLVKSTSAVRQPYVLIVEDNSVNALILATFLKKRGYPFAKAENGFLAVQAVQARPEGFDVILMDIQSTPAWLYQLTRSAGDGWINSDEGNPSDRRGTTYRSSSIYCRVNWIGGGSR